MGHGWSSLSPLQRNLLNVVIWIILLGVPYLIAFLISKKLLKGKSAGLRIAAAIITYVVSFVFVLFALTIASLATFGR